MSKFVEKVSALMLKKGLNQAKLAGELGVSQKAVSNWLLGKFVPTAEKLKKLSELLGTSVESLIDDSIVPPPLQPATTGEVFDAIPSNLKAVFDAIDARLTVLENADNKGAQGKKVAMQIAGLESSEQVKLLVKQVKDKDTEIASLKARLEEYECLENSSRSTDGSFTRHVPKHSKKH